MTLDVLMLLWKAVLLTTVAFQTRVSSSLYILGSYG